MNSPVRPPQAETGSLERSPIAAKPNSNPVNAELQPSSSCKPDDFTLTGSRLLTTKFPKPVPIAPGLLFDGRDAILGGHYGIGKTTVAIHIGLGIAAGEEVFGLPVNRPHKVLYLDLELGRAEFVERYLSIQALYRNPERHTNFIYIDASPDSPLFKKFRFDGTDRILKLTQQVRAEFVIVDNLSLIFVGDLESPSDCLKFRERVSEIRSKNPAVRSFLFPAHLVKPSGFFPPNLLHDPRSWLRDIRGSGKLLDHFTVRLGFDSMTVGSGEEEQVVHVLNGISSHGPISPICLERFDGDMQPPQLKVHSDRDLKAKTIFTKAEFSVWASLPSSFRPSAINSHKKRATTTSADPMARYPLLPSVHPQAARRCNAQRRMGLFPHATRRRYARDRDILAPLRGANVT